MRLSVPQAVACARSVSCFVTQVTGAMSVAAFKRPVMSISHDSPACSINVVVTPQFQQCMQPGSVGFAAGYAKKAGKEAKNASAAQDLPEYSPEQFERLMKAAVQHFQDELGKIHTGRASPGLLEPVVVIGHNEKLPLKEYGTVTARNAQLLAVTVYNPADLELVAKSIQLSPLKLQARVEGKEVLVPVPRPTLETIKGMVKLVNQEAESARKSVRNAQRKALDAVAASFTSTDFRKREEAKVKKMHDTHIAEVERLKKLKDKDLQENH